VNADLAAEIEREEARLQRAKSALGHRFKSDEILLRALTHSSVNNERRTFAGNNEVLELLGDAVLALCATETLLAQSPDANEGELTDRRAAYVSEDALAKKADESGLTELLRTGKSIEGNVPVSARADLVEALLGAVYVDGGLDAARAVIARVLGEPPRSAPPQAHHAKRVLQERLQRLFGAPPTYEVLKVDGPNHAPIFRAVAMFLGKELGRGDGANKRTATEAAAAAALASMSGDDDMALRERFGSIAQS
jgi:ribonuclease-3